ncbi:chromate transporter [Methylovirgula sp. 4M-Z18]|uniref:chromate transporter n=1 Tax=Methylovirgula sp. 4M-Z18 TaxID=2293567 RepID=UPI000E2E8BCE|nr:chromate transporter [Methylovirgula sp. 4M-Z18]RFB79672.1 chromate transporter [Methylovirgula sp. 4M-Z18]
MKLPASPPRPLELFLGFLKIGLLGFGGVAASARHVIVEERKWLDNKDYAEVLGLGQILPGANTVNAAVMIGDRFCGIPGAAASVSGLLAMPICILIGLAILYERYAALPDVALALQGAAAAAAGLAMGTALKMGKQLKRSMGGLVFGLIAFAAIGLLHLPLAPTVFVVAPLSVLAAYWESRHG